MNTWDATYANCIVEEDSWEEDDEGSVVKKAAAPKVVKKAAVPNHDSECAACQGSHRAHTCGTATSKPATKKRKGFWAYETTADRLDNKWGPISYLETTIETLNDFLLLKGVDFQGVGRKNERKKRELYVKYLKWWSDFGDWRGTMEGWEDELLAIKQVHNQDVPAGYRSVTAETLREFLIAKKVAGVHETKDAKVEKMELYRLYLTWWRTEGGWEGTKEGWEDKEKVEDKGDVEMATSSSTTSTSGKRACEIIESPCDSDDDIVVVKEVEEEATTTSSKGPSKGGLKVKLDKLGEAIMLRDKTLVTLEEYEVLKRDIIDNKFERFDGVFKLVRILNNDDINGEDYKRLMSELFSYG